jgi:hypothetical protein
VGEGSVVRGTPSGPTRLEDIRAAGVVGTADGRREAAAGIAEATVATTGAAADIPGIGTAARVAGRDAGSVIVSTMAVVDASMVAPDGSMPSVTLSATEMVWATMGPAAGMGAATAVAMVAACFIADSGPAPRQLKEKRHTAKLGRHGNAILWSKVKPDNSPLPYTQTAHKDTVRTKIVLP